ncbi:Rho GTPase-activating protein 22/24/25 [Pelomyxa schiedti]|nr:Rho GTPase-activating protein 22/24/25 [Pelomyxa schiedti]
MLHPEDTEPLVVLAATSPTSSRPQPPPSVRNARLLNSGHRRHDTAAPTTTTTTTTATATATATTTPGASPSPGATTTAEASAHGPIPHAYSRFGNPIRGTSDDSEVAYNNAPRPATPPRPPIIPRTQAASPTSGMGTAPPPDVTATASSSPVMSRIVRPGQVLSAQLTSRRPARAISASGATANHATAVAIAHAHAVAIANANANSTGSGSSSITSTSTSSSSSTSSSANSNSNFSGNVAATGITSSNSGENVVTAEGTLETTLRSETGAACTDPVEPSAVGRPTVSGKSGKPFPVRPLSSPLPPPIPTHPPPLCETNSLVETPTIATTTITATTTPSTSTNTSINQIQIFAADDMPLPPMAAPLPPTQSTSPVYTMSPSPTCTTAITSSESSEDIPHLSLDAQNSALPSSPEHSRAPRKPPPPIPTSYRDGRPVGTRANSLSMSEGSSHSTSLSQSPQSPQSTRIASATSLLRTSDVASPSPKFHAMSPHMSNIPPPPPQTQPPHIHPPPPPPPPPVRRPSVLNLKPVTTAANRVEMSEERREAFKAYQAKLSENLSQRPTEETTTKTEESGLKKSLQEAAKKSEPSDSILNSSEAIKSKSKKRRKKKHFKFFGSCLREILEWGDVNGVPTIIFSMVEFLRREEVLNSEGIFRLSASTLKLQELQKLVEDTPELDLSTVELCREEPLVVASLLTRFLRCMAEPIFPFESYVCFISVHGIPNPVTGAPDDSLRLNKMKGLFQMMIPPENVRVIKYVMQFLSEVAQHSDKNKMTVENLGTVFGPALMREAPIGLFGTTDVSSIMTDSGIVAELVSMVISNWQLLCTF